MKKVLIILVLLLGLGGAAYYFLGVNQGSESQIETLLKNDTLSGHYETSYSGFTVDLDIENAETATLSVGASFASISLKGDVDTTSQTITIVIDNALIANAFGVEEGVEVVAYYDQISDEQVNLTLGDVTLEFDKV